MPNDKIKLAPLNIITKTAQRIGLKKGRAKLGIQDQKDLNFEKKKKMKNDEILDTPPKDIYKPELVLEKKISGISKIERLFFENST